MINTCPDPKPLRLCRIRDGNTMVARPQHRGYEHIAFTQTIVSRCTWDLPAARAVFFSVNVIDEKPTFKGLLQQRNRCARA